MDVRLVLPFHGAIHHQNIVLRPAASFTVPSLEGPVQADAVETELDGIPVYLISGPPISKDAPVYGPDPAMDAHKFTFFSLAALELARALDWAPHIVQAIDWHTAPAVYALRLRRRGDPFFAHTAAVLGLHNLPYLGVGGGTALSSYGLPPAEDSALPEWAKHTPLPLGLWAADHIVAASPTYAREILKPEFGAGLHEFLESRQNSITGILNGIDIQKWDPSTDPALEVRFQAGELQARSANKIALQKEFGLQTDAGIPLMAIVSRLDPQKGIDLLPEALEILGTGHPWQIILLGSGVPALEASARQIEINYPERVCAALRFDAALSRRLYGGADMLLIPSRYEPCGLNQMIAMRYGCVPVARSTGGLRDTVHDYHRTAESTGFLFKQATSWAFARAIRQALRVYANPPDWRAMQQRGMAQDFSWENAARQYQALYQRLAREMMRPG